MTLNYLHTFRCHYLSDKLNEYDSMREINGWNLQTEPLKSMELDPYIGPTVNLSTCCNAGISYNLHMSTTKPKVVTCVLIYVRGGRRNNIWLTRWLMQKSTWHLLKIIGVFATVAGKVDLIVSLDSKVRIAVGRNLEIWSVDFARLFWMEITRRERNHMKVLGAVPS